MSENGDPTGEPRPAYGARRVGHLLTLLARAIVNALQPVRLLADRLYRAVLRLLVVLVKGMRYISVTLERAWSAVRSFFRRSWRFLAFLPVKRQRSRDASARGRLAASRFYPGDSSAEKSPPQNDRHRRFDVRSWFDRLSSERASKRFRRLSSFLVKEILEVVQQPRLVVTMILGPFLILLIFGVGFTGKQGPAPAIVVVPPDAEFPLDIKEQLVRYKGFMPIHSVAESREEALAYLQDGTVEIVAVLPSNSQHAVLSGQQAVIDIYVDEYDPLRTQWLNYVAGFAADDLNRQLLSMALDQGRETLSSLQGVSTGLLDRLVEVGATVEAGDIEQAKEHLDEALVILDDEAERLDPALHDLVAMQAAVEAFRTAGRRPDELFVSLAQVRGRAADLRELLNDPELETRAVLNQIRQMRETLTQVQEMADLLAAIPDEVLVAPVATQVMNTSLSEPAHLSFYTPAVLALLLQHMAMTFGSLTMVRERLLGADELFRISPIAPWEILTGKFLGYTLLTAVIGAVLSGLLVLFIKVPLLGNVFLFVLTLVLMATASLGWGIFVSLFSRTQSQAVQFSLLLLITSVFFGGFFLALSSLHDKVRSVSYALPVTYGVKALREIMLAGRGPGADTLLPLAGMSVGFYLISILVYTWQNKRA